MKSMQSEFQSKWEFVMKDELSSLTQYETWELMTLSTRNMTLNNKWVYKVKNKELPT